jgi:SAM-dependent methyltransferase
MGVELSAAHRAFIRQHWSIETTGEPLEEDRLLADHYQTVVSFNCIEHVLDPVAEMIAVRRVLVPGGVFLFTTCNADSLLGRLPGGYWTMFKPPDHVSIGSAESFARAARRAGLSVGEVFYSEYPFETPLGMISALRDAWRERRPGRPAVVEEPVGTQLAPPASKWARGVRNRLQHWESRWSPATLTGRYGVSSTIGVQLQRQRE